TTSNTTIQYKTWISSASNNNTNGIQTTNNAYTPYALGANGNLQLTFNALAIGTYTLNFQAKDEYGNESEVKSFNVTVEDYITFEGNQTAELLLAYDSRSWIIQKGFNRTLKIKAGGNSTITNIAYTLDYDIANQGQAPVHKSYSYNEVTNTTSNTVDLNGFYSTNNVNTNVVMLNNVQILNRTLKVKATTSTGQTKEITIIPTFNGISPL
ncbi:hypothetical protein, partial [Chryseobacterium sp.]|uniref:hypothetical protein n=1 Tax=Chryseobacterium sp. TaxID=1871047 RepID=UPI00289773E1